MKESFSKKIEIAGLILAFSALAGFIVLNYGFNNWPLQLAGLSLPLGHVLAVSALFLLAVGQKKSLKSLWRTPLIWAWAGLMLLSAAHLIYDIPRFRGWAVRDASFVAEGAFLGLGFLFSVSAHRREIFLRFLSIVFSINFVYTLTYPFFADTLQMISPVGGIFRPVPLLGFYSSTSHFLLLGALFSLWQAQRHKGWTRYGLWLLAVVQVGWTFIFQARSIYLSMLLSVVIILVFLGWRKALVLAGTYVVAFVVFLVVISILVGAGLPIRGRIGDVEPGFYWRHLLSIWYAFFSPTSAVPALGSAIWRLRVWREALGHWLATPETIVVGEGFGQVLINFELGNDVAVRQPHNIFLTVLARLGLVGFALWVWMQVQILLLFWQALCLSSRLRPSEGLLALWLFISYLSGMLLASVQPWLEFSYGAIPFFTTIGFSLGLLAPVAMKEWEQTA